jgi:hypothetical protein
MNNGNLIPNPERTPSELREMARRGGINSGIARRRKREIAQALQFMPMDKATSTMIDAILLAMTAEQLVEFCNNPKMPAEARRRARLLSSKSDKEAVEMGERMRDRVFGKPIQTVESDMTPPVINVIQTR